MGICDESISDSNETFLQISEMPIRIESWMHIASDNDKCFATTTRKIDRGHLDVRRVAFIFNLISFI